MGTSVDGSFYCTRPDGRTWSRLQYVRVRNYPYDCILINIGLVAFVRSAGPRTCLSCGNHSKYCISPVGTDLALEARVCESFRSRCMDVPECDLMKIKATP